MDDGESSAISLGGKIVFYTVCAVIKEGARMGAYKKNGGENPRKEILWIRNL
jgi:hypothetical protein